MKLSKKIFSLVMLALLSGTLVGCFSNSNENQQQPDGYDYIFGNDYSDLVKITFKYGNIQGKIGDTYKVWGVPRNSKLGFDYEPKYPEIRYKIALYGLNTDFTADNDINYNTYVFSEDTTLYVKYYEVMLEIRFCIPNGPTNKGSGMMFSYKALFGNTEIYRLPTLDNQTFSTDWGEFDITQKAIFDPYITQWGWTKIIGWYYDEELTQEITTPFRLSNNGDQLKFWVKAE